ncbi:Monothiol glutaredoxin-S17 [Vitis vinifera]|uniref:Monothiol glutaredoxin-S17 n=1 Tax=Vitis vinifera TaxID=29760 RepID=A0A438DQZ3_VITVI|nr:Monothiol glutaredoxin-S17 [Vitis vinifera]
MGGSVKDVESKEELDNVVRQGAPVILHFWASWCEASKHMDQVFSHLSTDFPHAVFFRVEAEEQPVISEAYSVSAVPYFVFFKAKRSKTMGETKHVRSLPMITISLRLSPGTMI